MDFRIIRVRSLHECWVTGPCHVRLHWFLLNGLGSKMLQSSVELKTKVAEVNHLGTVLGPSWLLEHQGEIGRAHVVILRLIW